MKDETICRDKKERGLVDVFISCKQAHNPTPLFHTSQTSHICASTWMEIIEASKSTIKYHKYLANYYTLAKTLLMFIASMRTITFCVKNF